MFKLDEVDSFNNSTQNGLDILKQSLCGAISSSQHSIASATLGFTAEDVELSANAYEFGSLGMGIFPPGGPASLHLSNQVEQSQAYTWIMSHLEEDSKTCLRKDEVYDDYRAYCEKHHMKTLNTADFGKVMKRAYPNVKPRRLGQRGQSRYCYGGMRKKMEVQPPFLPDLTDETLSGAGGGAASLTNLGHSTTSPTSSSGASLGGGDGHRQRLCSPASLARMLHSTNGHEPGGSGLGEDAHVWSVLGLRGGPVVADVAHLLLEYAHQVFGLHFHSLFHLAHHLVTNRYVNSRSRHALALIAHTTNGPPLSPPPSAALAEALQKGVNKSAFGRVANGKMKVSAPQRPSHVKSEDDASLSLDSQRTPNRYPTGGSLVGGGNSPLISTPTSSNLGLSQSHLQPPLTDSRSTSNTQHSLPHTSPFSLTADLSAVQHLPTCSTPQPMTGLGSAGAYQQQQQGRTADYQANFSPQTTCTIASALASQAAALGVTSPVISHYSHPFSMSTPPSMLRHPTAAAATLAAAAAAAAHHRQQQHQQYLSSLPDQLSVYGARQITGDFPLSISAASNTGLRKENKLGVSGFALSSTESMGYSGYQQQQQQQQPHQLKQQQSPATNSTNSPQQPVYAAHQQIASPYQCSQQPPVPLPPGVTARSAYTPVGQPPVGSLDHQHHHQQHHHNNSSSSTPPSSAGAYKRAPPNPVDAPGAYEPSPRFHLGGQSPTKRPRYVSANAGSGSSLPEFPPQSGNNTAATATDSLHDRQHFNSQRAVETTPGSREAGVRVGYPMPSTSTTTVTMSITDKSSSGVNQHETSARTDYTGGQRVMGTTLAHQSPLPHYFQHSAGGYDTGGGRANSASGSHLTDTSTDEAWSVSQLTSVNGKLGSHCQSTGFPGLDSLSSRDYLVPSGKTTSGPFRPPITPFSLKLDECDELTNLPRLGSSPGPQIPPSSPTEFLPFYSEAASKAKQQHLSNNRAGVTPSHHGSSSDGEDLHQHPSGESSATRADTTVSLETPPSSARQTRIRTNSVSSTDSDDSKNRTLTRFDPVTTPPMPGGLANVPSPSECGPQRAREELQTPSPTDNNHCLSLEQETSSTGSCPSSTEVRAC